MVNFYNVPPVARQIASDLSDHELVVFTHLTSGGRILADQVQELVNFSVNLHHENTIPKWNGEDYFVMTRASLGYHDMRKNLRALAVDWVASGYPNQVKHI